MDELTVQRTHCTCHPETCGHWPYSLMLGSECITTGEKADCDRLLALLTTRNTRAASGGDSASLGQRAWMFYFTDDAYTPFAYVCHGRGGLEQGVIAWLGEDAIADSGERMAPAIVEALMDAGEFRAEDGACYAKPISAAALANQQGVGGWRPIETAPQGTMILLADMTAKEARHWSFVGWKHHWNKAGHVETPSALNRRATHWKHLPEPPTQPAGDVGSDAP